MEYGTTIWNPYLKVYIDKLERIQNRATRFIKKDYHNGSPGTITKLKQDLELDTLEERRESLRLIFMYKVVEGLVPSLPSSQFVNFERPKRQIKPKTFKDYHTKNIIDKHVCNNSRWLVIPHSRTLQYQHLFFVHTCISWNHLPDSALLADSVEGFKTALRDNRQ